MKCNEENRFAQLICSGGIELELKANAGDLIPPKIERVWVFPWMISLFTPGTGISFTQVFIELLGFNCKLVRTLWGYLLPLSSQKLSSGENSFDFIQLVLAILVTARWIEVFKSQGYIPLTNYAYAFMCSIIITLWQNNLKRWNRPVLPTLTVCLQLWFWECAGLARFFCI